MYNQTYPTVTGSITVGVEGISTIILLNIKSRKHLRVYLKGLLKFCKLQKGVLQQDILLNLSLLSSVLWIILNKYSQYINLRMVKWMHIWKFQKIWRNVKSIHLWSIYYDKLWAKTNWETFLSFSSQMTILDFLRFYYPLYLQQMTSLKKKPIDVWSSSSWECSKQVLKMRVINKTWFQKKKKKVWVWREGLGQQENSDADNEDWQQWYTARDIRDVIRGATCHLSDERWQEQKFNVEKNQHLKIL